MPALIFSVFGGQIPALDERLLPITNAVYAENAFLQAGRLEPLAADIQIHQLADPLARYAFRIPKADPSIDYLTDSYWLEFPRVDTYVVRSPITNDAEGGIYYWADGQSPPGYTTRARVVANAAVPDSAPPLVVGIPRPTVAPVIGPITGGAIPTVTRAYVYTWVSAYGEEGQPSPPAIDTGNADATWNLTVTAPSLADTTDRNLTKTRIYRTETGTDGSVDFFLVTELPIATLTFADNVSSDIVTNNPTLRSADWSPPPADLKGMVSMPNGMVAGWRNNEVWFCEPYRPYAWPVKYMIGVESPIVGLGTIDQNCMILTAGQPYVATGVHPSVMALRKVQPLEPCTAPGSIVSTPEGVMYTSYNGLILIGPSGGVNVTFDTIRKDEWLKFLNLRTVQASYFMKGYYVYSGVADGVFQSDTFQTDAFQELDFSATMLGAHISSDQRLGYMTLRCDSPTFNVMTDLWTGETLVIRDGMVIHVDRRSYSPRQPYKWLSKIVQVPYKQNFAAAKIFFHPPNGPVESGPTTFKMYVDDRLRYTRPVSKSGEQFRLPSGYKADWVQFELEGEKMIFNMQVATSARELREV